MNVSSNVWSLRKDINSLEVWYMWKLWLLEVSVKSLLPASCLRYSCLPPVSWRILPLRLLKSPLPASCLRYSCLPPVSWRIILLRRFNPLCLLPACAILVFPLSLGVLSYYAGLIPPTSFLRYSCLPPVSWRILPQRKFNPPCMLPACAILVFALSLGVFSYYAGLIPPACFLPALFLSAACLLAYSPTTHV